MTALSLNHYDYLFKILIIGDTSVGKSSMLVRFADNSFSGSYISTIGVDFKIKTVNVDNNVVKLQIWDTAGQERFRTITQSYYKGSNGIIVVYDISNKDSFDNIKNWMVDIVKYASQNIQLFLIGNKSDLDTQRQVSVEEGQQFATSRNMIFFETSAKNGLNVTTVFTSFAKQMKDVMTMRQVLKNNIIIDDSHSISKNKCCFN